MSVTLKPDQIAEARSGLALDRLASGAHKGLMPRLHAGDATHGALGIAGYGADASVYVQPATGSVPGAQRKPVQRLFYAAVADVMAGAAIAATTWVDLNANNAFTVGSASAWLAVEIKLGLGATGATAGQVAARAVFNSAGTPLLVNFAPGYITPAAGGTTLAGGTFLLAPASLPTGANTVKVQLYGNAAFTAYCRAATAPNTEWLSIQVVEWGA